MKFIICKNTNEFAEVAARMVLDELRSNTSVCLPTGSTPIPVYEKLINLIENENIDVTEVNFFNLDEYVGLKQSHTQSYAYFLNQNFYNHIKINRSKLHLIDGDKEPTKMCFEYNNLIDSIGQFDLLVDGLGVNGHIAFNEPSDSLELRTHISQISTSTIQENSRFFSSEEEVPNRAITVGFADIMKSKKIIILATGEKKSQVINKLYHCEEITTEFPASILKLHNNVIVICDQDAAKDIN